MNGIDFGKELKQLRTSLGVSSKVLSTKVGKAVTYVSQLENGKIKNPDYNTCYQILTELGLEDPKAKGMLDYFGFISPEEERANQELDYRRMKQEEDKWISGWYEKRFDALYKKHSIFNDEMSRFIQHDISRAEKVINNLAKSSETAEEFDFLCSLLENDFSILDSRNKEKILNLAREAVQAASTQSFITRVSEAYIGEGDEE